MGLELGLKLGYIYVPPSSSLIFFIKFISLILFKCHLKASSFLSLRWFFRSYPSDPPTCPSCLRYFFKLVYAILRFSTKSIYYRFLVSLAQLRSSNHSISSIPKRGFIEAKSKLLFPLLCSSKPSYAD